MNKIYTQLGQIDADKINQSSIIYEYVAKEKKFGFTRLSKKASTDVLSYEKTGGYEVKFDNGNAYGAVFSFIYDGDCEVLSFRPSEAIKDNDRQAGVKEKIGVMGLENYKWMKISALEPQDVVLQMQIVQSVNTLVGIKVLGLSKVENAKYIRFNTDKALIVDKIVVK